jgi:hypothetical protein
VPRSAGTAFSRAYDGWSCKEERRLRKLHSQASGRKRRTHTSASIECIPSAPTVGRDLGKGRSAQRFPAFTVDGLPSRHATTSTRGRSGRSAGARTTPAPTTAPHPAVAWPPQSEPSSKLAAHLGARSSRQARRRSPVRRQYAGHAMADARPCGSRLAGQTTLAGADGGNLGCSHCCIIDRPPDPSRSHGHGGCWRGLKQITAQASIARA